MTTAGVSSPIGLHRVVAPQGVLPQSAECLDPSLPIRDDEVLVDVSSLNLDAASFSQLVRSHDGDGDAVRTRVLEIIRGRGKMHNPVTGSGGVLLGTVTEVGPTSPLGFQIGDRIATLLSLTATPLSITDGLASWNGLSEQVPAAGHAVLFARSLAAAIPADIEEHHALSVLDVCGAPALTARIIDRRQNGEPLTVLVIGGGKSGALSAAAAARLGCNVVISVPTQAERENLEAAGAPGQVVVADATRALQTRDAVTKAAGLADICVVCVNRPGCEQAAILATADEGTVIFFSMATHLPTAALSAESIAADVEMLIGSGYVPGNAEYALELYRSTPWVQRLFDSLHSIH